MKIKKKYDKFTNCYESLNGDWISRLRPLNGDGNSISQFIGCVSHQTLNKIVLLQNLNY